MDLNPDTISLDRILSPSGETRELYILPYQFELHQKSGPFPSFWPPFGFLLVVVSHLQVHPVTGAFAHTFVSVGLQGIWHKHTADVLELAYEANRSLLDKDVHSLKLTSVIAYHGCLKQNLKILLFQLL